MIIDIHTHNPFQENVLAIKNLSISELDELDQSNSFKYFSIGIHPWEVRETNPNALDKIEYLAANDAVKAIGECGLDKNSKAGLKEQCYYLERQIQISEIHQKPLILHCVAYFNEIISLRKRIKPTQDWIIHGYRGKQQLAKQLIDNGFALSFGEKHNSQSVEITPIDRLCIETDTSTTDIMALYKEIATIKGCLPKELNAACRLLKLYVC